MAAIPSGPRHGNPQEQWALPDTQGGSRGGPAAGVAIDNVELLEERPRSLFTKDGHPIICRTLDERALHPDRLNLDRRGFTLCPVLEGEEQLKLINFQHNSISRIENMSALRSLIFLDLYNNQIQSISGLEHATTLRVLMLGNNRISNINGLERLPLLDVLDLHSNQIETIENIGHLTSLRVLNLAGNLIRVVDGISNLVSLSELNLRRNKISSVACKVGRLFNLERLYLSHNDITNNDEVSLLGELPSVAEMALSTNPICKEYHFRDFWLDSLKTLRTLDGKRITDEDRRQATLHLRKKVDKRREAARASAAKMEKAARKELARENWQAAIKLSGKEGVAKAATAPSGASSSADDGNFELEGNKVTIFGEAFGVFDRSSTASITTLSFQYVHFDRLVPYFQKFRSRFPAVTSLMFSDTQLSTLRQINHLSTFKRLEHLTIKDTEPLLQNVTQWKRYVIHRLGHLPLKSINGEEILPEDRNDATLFATITSQLKSETSTARLSQLGTTSLPFHIMSTPPPVAESSKAGKARPMSANPRRGSARDRESSAREARERELAKEKEQQSKERDKEVVAAISLRARTAAVQFARTTVRHLVDEAIASNALMTELNSVWHEAVRITVKDCLEQAQNSDARLALHIGKRA